jgi:hypothetical protein
VDEQMATLAELALKAAEDHATIRSLRIQLAQAKAEVERLKTEKEA